MKLSLLIVFFITIGLGEPAPAIHCQNKHHASHEELMFSRDLLPEQNLYDILYYALDVSINPTSENISGSVIITLKAKGDGLTNIILDAADHLAIENISSTELSSFSHSDDRLTIVYTNSLSEGDEKEIVIHYHGGTGSGVAWEGGIVYSGSQLYSLNCPYGMSDWIPCKDHPSDKATGMDIKVSLPESYVVASNGVRSGITQNGDGTRTHHWIESYPIATYLFNISAASYNETVEYFHYSETDSMPIIYFTTGTVPSGFHYVETALPIFSNLFGLYPFIDEKFAINKVSSTGWAMEHQNNVTTATTSGMTQVHELGHQWFGDKVTTRDWQHGWLNEGFATYSEALYKEATQGTSSYHSYMNQMKWGWNDNNTVFTTDTIGVWDIFDIIIYYKGAWVNHMLRHTVGDSTYFEALRDYLDIYSGGNVVTEDLEAVMESHYGSDLNWFFDQWIYGNGHPEYDFLWAGSLSKVKISISQQTTGSYPALFTMPLDTRMRGENETEEIQVVWINQENANFLLNTDFQPTSITLDPNDWVLGYYSGSEVGLLGDINVDNQVNILDIIGTANYVLSQTELTEDQFFLMDVDGDNTITIMDIIQIVNIILNNTA